MAETAGRSRVVCIGEALVDQMPSGPRVGGAPLNLALHLARLGHDVALVSAVGQDSMGERVLERARRGGVDLAAVHVSASHPTGVVRVAFEDGEPHFEIDAGPGGEGVAWDHLPASVGDALVRAAQAVCFGTLAQRTEVGRARVQRLVRMAPGLRLLDVNLRPGGPGPAVVGESLELATAVKANVAELAWLGRELLGVEAAKAPSAMLARFGLEWLALTDGARGTTLFAGDTIPVTAPVPKIPSAPDADPVGAGDACAAALLHHALRGDPWSTAVARANELGAWIAARAGAAP